MKQTAIEWLIEQFYNDDIPFSSTLFKKAKEIEKEQTLHFGAKCCLMTTQQNDWTLEQLYNETFNE